MPEIRSENVTRQPEARLEEAKGLALAINLDIVDTAVVNLRDIDPSMLFGRGKVEQIVR